MQRLEITADQLISALLGLAATETVCILDSCGVSHLGSHLLIAGIEPISVEEASGKTVDETLSILDDAVSQKDSASVFTISYDLGKRLLDISPKSNSNEPDVYLARFDVLIVHDYNTGKTNLAGNADKFGHIATKLKNHVGNITKDAVIETEVSSNFTRDEYLSAIETIKEQIRDGNTYQTNLTQQLSAKLSDGLTPQIMFDRLRRDHPAPFAAFIKRLDSTVVSASPERFFRVDG